MALVARLSHLSQQTAFIARQEEAYTRFVNAFRHAVFVGSNELPQPLWVLLKLESPSTSTFAAVRRVATRSSATEIEHVAEELRFRGFAAYCVGPEQPSWTDQWEEVCALNEDSLGRWAASTAHAHQLSIDAPAMRRITRVDWKAADGTTDRALLLFGAPSTRPLFIRASKLSAAHTEAMQQINRLADHLVTRIEASCVCRAQSLMHEELPLDDLTADPLPLVAALVNALDTTQSNLGGPVEKHSGSSALDTIGPDVPQALPTMLWFASVSGAVVALLLGAAAASTPLRTSARLIAAGLVLGVWSTLRLGWAQWLKLRGTRGGPARSQRPMWPFHELERGAQPQAKGLMADVATVATAGLLQLTALGATEVALAHGLLAVGVAGASLSVWAVRRSTM